MYSFKAGKYTWVIIEDGHVHVHELFYPEFYCKHIFEEDMYMVIIIYLENFM